MITRFVEDVVAESSRRLAALAPAGADAVRGAGAAVVAFSPAIGAAEAGTKDFLFERMYRHPGVVAVRGRANAILRDLFAAFRRDPALMPAEWGEDLAGRGDARALRRVADYIAGMTDTFAVAEHRRLFPATPDLTWRG